LSISEALSKLEGRTKNIKFKDLLNICEKFFGPPRVSASSHHFFKTPWPGDPRINLQPQKGNAKPYQVKQVISALKKLQDMGS
jgi:hypothetical protein